MLETVPIASIQQKHQFRARMSQQTIDDYAEALLNGATFPPIDVRRLPDLGFGEPGGLFLADGYHRLAAHKKIGAEYILAEVKDSTEALLFEAAVSANSNHGLPRTQEDKRAAVRAALAHGVIGKRSDTQIAKLCGVSQPFVSKLRKDLRVSSDLPKTAKEIALVLDVPLLERWGRELPYSDPRRRAVDEQLELIAGVERGTRWQGSEQVTNFPKIDAAPMEWALSGDHSKGGPLLALWLRKLDEARDTTIGDAETWWAQLHAATTPAQCWALASASCVSFALMKQALLAGVQLHHWGQWNWNSTKLRKLAPASDHLAQKRKERLDYYDKEEAAERAARPEAPDVASYTLEQLQRESRVRWDDALRAACWERAQALNLPLSPCMGARCALPTPTQIDACLRCGSYSAHRPSQHAAAWDTLFEWHERTNSPLLPLLNALLKGDPWNVTPGEKRALRKHLEDGLVPGLKADDAEANDAEADDAEADDAEADDDDASEDEGLDDDEGAADD
ncbi:ParB/RepB/Spo0J family partition protein [Myxococcota bacterium]|nr:ParB/RepB/Spo0J family partition protein [Myxococcota bacterium]